MDFLPSWLRSAASKLGQFVLGVLVFWFAPISALMGRNGPPWLIHGDSSWRSLVDLFDNPTIIVCLSPFVCLYGLRLLGLKTPQPFIYSLCAVPLYGLGFVAIGLTALGAGTPTGRQLSIIFITVFSVLPGFVYVLLKKHRAYSYKQTVFWFLASFILWSIFVLPWEAWAFSRMSLDQRHYIENAAFGPSLERSKSFVRACQPFLAKYGHIKSLELDQGFAFYDAAKDFVDARSYILRFDAERGKGDVLIDVPEDAFGFSANGESYCGIP